MRDSVVSRFYMPFFLFFSFLLTIIVAAVGVGLSFCQNAAPLLLIELSYPTHVRATCVSGKICNKRVDLPDSSSAGE